MNKKKEEKRWLYAAIFAVSMTFLAMIASGDLVKWIS